MSNIFSALGADCDLKISSVCSAVIGRSDSAVVLLVMTVLPTISTNPGEGFLWKMNQLSDAMSCIAIDVVNNILVYTEHRKPLMAREDSHGRRVTQRNRKGPLESSNLMARQPFILAGNARHSEGSEKIGTIGSQKDSNKLINVKKKILPSSWIMTWWINICALTKWFPLFSFLFQIGEKSQRVSGKWINQQGHWDVANFMIFDKVVKLSAWIFKSAVTQCLPSNCFALNRSWFNDQAEHNR